MIVEIWRFEKRKYFIIDLKSIRDDPEEWMNKQGEFKYPDFHPDKEEEWTFHSNREAISALKNKFKTVYKISWRKARKISNRGNRYHSYFKCK